MTENSITKENILNKIKKGQVEMRPRVYFILKMLFFAVLTIFTFFLSLFIVSFIIFILKANGNLFLFGFGRSGFRMFLVSFPWLFGLLVVLLIGLLGIFAKEHKFVYTKPFAYSVLGIILMLLITGFLLSQTPFHNRLFDRAQRGGLPMMGQVYLKYGKGNVKDLHIGKVLDYANESLSMEVCGKQIFVEINENTKFYANINIQRDSMVVVIGRETDGVITAKGIKLMKGEMHPVKRCLTK